MWRSVLRCWRGWKGSTLQLALAAASPTLCWGWPACRRRGRRAGAAHRCAWAWQAWWAPIHWASSSAHRCARGGQSGWAGGWVGYLLPSQAAAVCIPQQPTPTPFHAGLHRHLQMRQAGVDVVSPPLPGAATGTVVVLTAQDASRTMLSYLGTPAEVEVDAALEAAIARSRCLVVEGAWGAGGRALLGGCCLPAAACRWMLSHPRPGCTFCVASCRAHTAPDLTCAVQATSGSCPALSARLPRCECPAAVAATAMLGLSCMRFSTPACCWPSAGPAALPLIRMFALPLPAGHCCGAARWLRGGHDSRRCGGGGAASCRALAGH